MITTTEQFNAAMQLWLDLTGMDPNAKSWTMAQWELRQMNEELKESMEYDDSMTTTYLLLDAFSADYFKNAKVSVAEFDEDPDKVFDYMDKVREFKALIRSPKIAQVADEFLERVRNALLHYGIDADRITDALADHHTLAILRRDALKSFNRLRVDHFMQGEQEPEGSQPIYNKAIYGYWNINSLIKHACSMPSGIAINLIRDPDELHSYFAISLRNGGNLVLLSDVPEYGHPLGRHMTRRPDREFADRTAKHWFPYQLLQIGVNDKGDPYHDKYRASQATDLVPHQHEHFELTQFADLNVYQIIWAVLVMDLLREKYWNQPIEPKALSYTNEMIQLERQHDLVATTAGVNLPTLGYQPLNLPELTKDDLRLANLDERALGNSALNGGENFGVNQWMEDRYADLVPDAALNLLGNNPNQTFYLSTGKQKTQHWTHKEPKALTEITPEVKMVELDPDDYFGNKQPLDRVPETAYQLESVDPTLFGTREQIDADRKFIARINFARAIQREADREFEERRPEILRWFLDGVEANIDTILGYAHHQKVKHIRSQVKRFAAKSASNGLEAYRFSYLMPYKVPEAEKYDWPTTYDLQTVKRFNQGFTRERGGFHKCFITGAKPTYRLYIQPGCPEDLALLTGTKLEDIPDVLQHWNPGDEPYTGNHILSRIDPMEWRCSNPWDMISFAIEVSLSKTGLKKVLQEHAPAPIPDLTGIEMTGITRQNNRGRYSKAIHSNWDTEKYLNEQN